MKNALTIAGSDSDGFAGIQADLKTFDKFHVHGLSVITAITAQSPKEIISIHAVPLQNIEDQLDVLLSSFQVDGIKTGMLHTVDVIELLANKLKNFRAPIIVDPVMIAGSGAMLLQKSAIRPLIETLLPIATFIMPNIPEAEQITGLKIRTVENMKEAIEVMVDMGIRGILLKGSHIKANKITDILYYEEQYHVYEIDPVRASAHGTGCILSSAFLANYIQGISINDSFQRSEEYVSEIMKERERLFHNS